MTTNPARRLLLLLVPLVVVLACTPPATPPETPPASATASKAVSLGETANQQAPPLMEILASVSVIDGKFSVSPKTIFVHDRTHQTIIWEPKDNDVEIEIEYKPAGQNPNNPTVQPPDKPCPAKAPKCGGDKPVGGRVGHFKYSVRGTKAGNPMPDLDPEVVILPEP